MGSQQAPLMLGVFRDVAKTTKPKSNSEDRFWWHHPGGAEIPPPGISTMAFPINRRGIPHVLRLRGRPCLVLLGATRAAG